MSGHKSRMDLKFEATVEPGRQSGLKKKALGSAAAVASLAMWGCRFTKSETEASAETDKVDVEEHVVHFSHQDFVSF